MLLASLLHVNTHASLQGCLIKERGATEFIGMPACSGVKVRLRHSQGGPPCMPLHTSPAPWLQRPRTAGLPPPSLNGEPALRSCSNVTGASCVRFFVCRWLTRLGREICLPQVFFTRSFRSVGQGCT